MLFEARVSLKVKDQLLEFLLILAQRRCFAKSETVDALLRLIPIDFSQQEPPAYVRRWVAFVTR